MAEIERYSGNVQAFGSQSQGTERTVFGDTTQSDTLDANITADFLRGWGIVGVNENPTKQDFNGLAFTLSQLIAYLHQRGIPEWNGSQEYFEGSVVTTLAGVYRLLSGGDGSVDPDADDGTNWEKAPTRAEIDQRAIYVGSVAELEAEPPAVGANVYLTEDGKAGEFVVKAGTPPSDPQKGIYIVLADGNYAERQYSGAVSAKWFGAVGDGSTDDTASLQAAIDYCIRNKKSLYIPSGDYLHTGLVYDYGGVDLSTPAVAGIRTFGDGGWWQRVYGAEAPNNTTLTYAGTTGSAIRTAGKRNYQTKFEDMLIRGTGGTVTSSPTLLTGTTAVGLYLAGSISHNLTNLAISGFDKGLHNYFSFVGTHDNCSIVQNNINVHFDSASNSMSLIGSEYHQGFKAAVYISPQISSDICSRLTFTACNVEGSPLGVVIDPQSAGVENVTFINAYIEVSDEIFRIGYDLDGAFSPNDTSNIYINNLDYTGDQPTVFFKLNRLRKMRIEGLDIAYAGSGFDLSASVTDIKINGDHFFGNAMNLPLADQAFKKGIQRASNHNLLAGGNYLVSNGSWRQSQSFSETFSYVNGEPVVEFTVPTGVTDGFLEWTCENSRNLHDQLVQILARGEVDSDPNFSVQPILYNQDLTTIVTLSQLPSLMDTVGQTNTVPATATAFRFRLLINNSSGVSKTFRLRGVYMFRKDSDALETDGVDVMSSMSGTVTANMTATVSVPFFRSEDYRVIITPLALANFYVTKSASSFTINSDANADFDYLVIPRARVLQ